VRKSRKRTSLSTSAQPWYAEGLRFSCLRCGDCCRGEPGYVWITEAEARAAAAHLGIEVADFHRHYVRQVGNRLSLIELPNGDCIFWSPMGCDIYPVRPTQCRTFPFWAEYLSSERAWLQARRRCPGVGSGKLFSLEEIQSKLREHRQ